MSNKNILWHEHSVRKIDRTSIKNQKPCVLWFTGLSGSGKSTVANAVELKLNELGKHTYLLDGDNIRLGLNKDLSFSNSDRGENIRRISEVSKLFVDAGLFVLTAFISPFQKDREQAKGLMKDKEFIEIHIDCPLHVCESRDPKGLYLKARTQGISNFTGISSPYEAPLNPDIYINSHTHNLEKATMLIINYLETNSYLTK